MSSALTSALAIVSKYVFRTRAGNVFNPAALAIVATLLRCSSRDRAGGARCRTCIAALVQVLLFATGIFITDRVNKMPLVLAFLGTYYLLFTVTAFVGDPARVAEDLPRRPI